LSEEEINLGRAINILDILDVDSSERTTREQKEETNNYVDFYVGWYKEDCWAKGSHHQT
jgi:hypothetical protein